MGHNPTGGFPTGTIDIWDLDPQDQRHEISKLDTHTRSALACHATDTRQVAAIAESYAELTADAQIAVISHLIATVCAPRTTSDISADLRAAQGALSVTLTSPFFTASSWETALERQPEHHLNLLPNAIMARPRQPEPSVAQLLAEPDMQTATALLRGVAKAAGDTSDTARRCVIALLLNPNLTLESVMATSDRELYSALSLDARAGVQLARQMRDPVLAAVVAHRSLHGWGGEEFSIVIDDAPDDNAVAHIIRTLRAANLSMPWHELKRSQMGAESLAEVPAGAYHTIPRALLNALGATHGSRTRKLTNLLGYSLSEHQLHSFMVLAENSTASIREICDTVALIEHQP